MFKSVIGDIHTFRSIGTVEDIEILNMFPPEIINPLSLSGLPEHELKLKVDTAVILL